MALAAKHRLPAIYPRGDFVENGGLMSYGPDQTEPYRRVAYLVDKILKGTKPADHSSRAADQVRIGDKSKNGQTNRPDDSANVLMRAEKVIK